MRRTHNDPMVETALELAGFGIPVFPLHHPVPPDDESSEIRWGQANCSCRRLNCPTSCAHPLYGEQPTGSVNPDRIELWWTHHPQANIGVQTGQTCDVVETDQVLGQVMLALLERAGHPRPPVTLTADGRCQWWMATTLGLPVCRFGPDDPRDPLLVRILGAGGFVVAPPSRLVSGERVLWLHQLHHKLPSANLLLQTLLDAHHQIVQPQLGPPPPATQPVFSSPRRAASPSPTAVPV